MNQELPPHLHRLVEEELASGERLRWLGQPSPRPGIAWMTLLPALFGIPWTAFAVFWMAGAGGFLDGPRPGLGNQGFDVTRMVFSLFGIPFVLIGLAMLASPFWMQRRRKRAAEGTAYAITDRRAIIFDAGYHGDAVMASLVVGLMRPAGKSLRIQSYLPGQLKQIERLQREDGSGDLLFGDPMLVTTTQVGWQPTQVMPIPRAGFFSIEEVKTVEEHLRALAATAAPTKETS